MSSGIRSGISSMIKNSWGASAHAFAAETWRYGAKDGAQKCSARDGQPLVDKHNEPLRFSNRSTMPIVGAVTGTVGMVASLVQIAVGAIGMIVFVIPACCSDTARQGLRAAAWTALCGTVMLVAYPCMMAYGHTIGWIECCCCSGSGQEKKVKAEGKDDSNPLLNQGKGKGGIHHDEPKRVNDSEIVVDNSDGE